MELNELPRVGRRVCFWVEGGHHQYGTIVGYSETGRTATLDDQRCEIRISVDRIVGWWAHKEEGA